MRVVTYSGTTNLQDLLSFAASHALLRASIHSPILPHTLICPLCLSFLSERIREPAHVLLKRAMVLQELHICSIIQDLSCRTLLKIFLTTERREAPIFADDNLLAAREFILKMLVF